MIDISRSIDVVTVSEDGELSINKDDLATIFDIVPFDSESNTGDYIFARYANKGTLQKMYLYRFE